MKVTSSFPQEVNGKAHGPQEPIETVGSWHPIGTFPCFLCQAEAHESVYITQVRLEITKDPGA